MKIYLRNGEILDAVEITAFEDGFCPSYFVENWSGGIHEYYVLAQSEVFHIAGKDGIVPSWW